METLQIIGAFTTLAGSIFIFLGALGLIRMPDVYNRIQAGTKASTLGTLLSLTGLALIIPAWWTKLVLLAIFIIITNPVSSHVLARASHFAKIKLSKQTVSDLYEEYKQSKNVTDDGSES
jgi:multicomponent Na+:H+ antiporter subunit G